MEWVAVSSIKCSQSSIAPRLRGPKPKIHVERTPFDISRYTPIKVVYFPETSTYTSYDNRRLVWARGEGQIRCLVKQATEACRGEEPSERTATISWPDGPNVREALIMAKRYDAWLALRCATQGASFPLNGHEVVEGVPEIKEGQPTHTHVKSRPDESAPINDLHTATVFQDLESAQEVYLAGGGPARFYHPALLAFLQDDGPSKFSVVEYTLIEKCTIEIRGQADHWDDEAFDKEYERLVRIGRIDEDDKDEDDEVEDDANAQVLLHTHIPTNL